MKIYARKNYILVESNTHPIFLFSAGERLLYDQLPYVHRIKKERLDAYIHLYDLHEVDLSNSNLSDQIGEIINNSIQNVIDLLQSITSLAREQINANFPT